MHGSRLCHLARELCVNSVNKYINIPLPVKPIYKIINLYIITMIPKNSSKDGEKAFVPSRGMRNNNPLNIRRYITNDWMGKIVDSVATDMEFEQFRHPKYGFRAAFILIHRYIKMGYNTVRDIITRWAPPGDGNFTDSYVTCVCNDFNMEPNQEIHCYKYSEMSALVEGMFRVENGKYMCSLPDRTFWYKAMSEGYDLYRERFVQ